MSRRGRGADIDFPTSQSFRDFYDGGIDFRVSKTYSAFLCASGRGMERDKVGKLQREILELKNRILDLEAKAFISRNHHEKNSGADLRRTPNTNSRQRPAVGLTVKDLDNAVG